MTGKLSQKLHALVTKWVGPKSYIFCLNHHSLDFSYYSD